MKNLNKLFNILFMAYYIFRELNYTYVLDLYI